MTDPQLPPPTAAAPPAPPAAWTAPPAVPPAAPYPITQAPPPGAYQVPVGGYPASSGGYAAPAPTPAASRSAFLGILALVLAVVAAIATPIVVGVTGYEIGRRLPAGIDGTSGDVLAVLSPARDQVLWAEMSFWTGTALGIAAIVIGIIAIRRKRGRGAGIAAIVVAALAPAIFFVVLLFAFSTGGAAGLVGLST